MNAMRSATPLARATSFAAAMAASGSMATTREAPTRQANTAKNPIPVPTSTTESPGRIAAESAAA
jgi:hypothetical protein